MADRTSPLASQPSIADEQVANKGRRKVVRMFSNDSSSSDEGAAPEALSKAPDDRTSQMGDVRKRLETDECQTPPVTFARHRSPALAPAAVPHRPHACRPSPLLSPKSSAQRRMGAAPRAAQRRPRHPWSVAATIRTGATSTAQSRRRGPAVTAQACGAPADSHEVKRTVWIDLIPTPTMRVRWPSGLLMTTTMMI